jgi:hypothetical protein
MEEIDLMLEAKEKTEELKRVLSPMLLQLSIARLSRHYIAHTENEFKELDSIEDYHEELIRQVLGFTMPKNLR